MRNHFVFIAVLLMSIIQPTEVNCEEQAFARLPLYFLQNQGQVQGDAAFYVPGADRTLYFTAEGVTFDLFSRDGEKVKRWTAKLDFVGADPDARPRGEERQDAVFSFFKGRSEDWKRGVPAYSKLVYEDLWPGIDLVYSGSVHQVKYEFIVKPGADPGKIRLSYRGVTEVALQENGALKVITPSGGFEDGVPYAYQGSKEVSMDYALHGETGEGEWTYGFHLGDYDATKPLVLDPVLNVYCGYIGGISTDDAKGIAVDKAGNVYVTGQTHSTQTSFPVTVGPNLYHSNLGSDAFVAKVNAQGTALLYCGYIGGNGDQPIEGGFDIDVDSDGNAYVIGTTSSDQATFPVKLGPDLTYNGGQYDAFVAKVNAQGTDLDYCGYIGGEESEEGWGIDVDAYGNAYVTGFTASDSTTFPAYFGPDLSYNGGLFDVFVAKVNPSGQALHFCGYIGGNSEDRGVGISVDSNGDAYVSGITSSDEMTFPVLNGPDLSYNGGMRDAFIAKVHDKGLALEYCGYIGGIDSDHSWDVVVDDTGAAMITGYTYSSESTFPECVGPDLTYNGDGDAFVAKVNPQGTNLYFCGYIGGTGTDTGRGIALDKSGRALVSGYTSSTETSFPVKIGPDLTFNGGTRDAFVAMVGAQGLSLEFCGYLGGDDWDESWDLAVDHNGNTYMTGMTASTESSFPAVSGPDLSHNGGQDAFVAKIEVTPGMWYVDDDNTGGPWQGTSLHPFQFIQDGIDIALENDTVLVRPGTYLENPDFMGKEITVQSSDGPEFTVIDGGHPSNPFQGSVVKLIGEGPEAVLEGFTLTNGYGSKIGADPFYKGGAILCISSMATIRNNILVKNSASPGHGGGIYVSYGSPTIEGNVITENSASGSPGCGGAIFIYLDASASETLHVENNDLSWNDASDNGGGICMDSEAGNPNWPDLVDMANNTISGNDSQGKGGGIYCSNYASPRIRGNILSLNRAIMGGGGLMLSYHAQPVIDGNLISGNEGDWTGSGEPGGGIRCDSFSSPSITNNMIIENTAGGGSGIACIVGSDPDILNNTIAGNVASGMGGGIRLFNGCSVIITNTLIWDNDAASDIEIHLENACSLNIDYSDVEGGQASVHVGFSSSLTWGTKMIDVDPLFVDPGASDYHLSAASSCIDAGYNGPFMIPLPPKDFEGDRRFFPGNGKGFHLAGSPSGAVVDMGADEYCLLKRHNVLVK